MKDYDDYRFTYSELIDRDFDGSRADWLEYLSPQAVEAYNEYIKDSSNKETD